MIDPDRRVQRPVAQVLLVMDAHLADEGLGLAGGVVLDLEIPQFDGERQFLHQKTVAQPQKHEIGRAALGQHDVAAKRRRRAGRQPAGRRHVAGGQVAGLDRDLAAPFLQLQPQVAIQQTADSDHHHRRVGEQIAQPLVTAFHRRRHLMIAVVPHPPAVAARAKRAGNFRDHVGGRPLRQPPFGALVKPAQRIQPNLGAKPDHLPRHAGNLPVQANAGGEDQKSQDGDEPAGAIHIVQPQAVERFEPERAEFEHVVRIGLVLLQHRADDRGDGHHHQQGDGEVHGTEEFQQHPTQGTALGGPVRGDGVAHGGDRG